MKHLIRKNSHITPELSLWARSPTLCLVWVVAIISLVLLTGCGTNPGGSVDTAAVDDSIEEGELSAETEEMGMGECIQDLVVAEGDGLPDELPSDLEWITNDTDPEFASPDAVQGGMFRSWMLAYPLTIRTVGPDSNGSFAGWLRPQNFGLVSIHPNTRNVIPILATHWAFGEDGRTIYYRINPEARWSDGEPVTADDWVFALKFMRSECIVAPWYNNYYTERIRHVKKYDELTFGIQGADPKPEREMHYNYGYGPIAMHFNDMTENWVRDYQWEPQPTTGPYHVGKMERGKYIELHRTKDWWAGDMRYTRNRFNPEKIRVTVIRDMQAAWLRFLAGELDTFDVTRPQFWHDKAIGEIFDKGYSGKYWFYNKLPVPSAGMYLNTSHGDLADKNVRYGLAHSMNIEQMIETVLRNDYERFPTFQLGFGEYDNIGIKPRTFDLEKASEYFEAAGYGERDREGIRIKLDEEGNIISRLEFQVTYGNSQDQPRLLVLAEEAKKAGVSLKLDLLDSAASFKKMLEKKHQIAWLTWASQGLSPRYWEHFHSDNADKPQTNNVTNTKIPEMDELIMTFRASADFGERVQLAHTLEQMVHDHGAVIPTIQVPYTRTVAWDWIKLPQWLGTATTSSLFNSQAPSGGVYSSGGLMWIDQEKREEILDAKKQGDIWSEPILVKDETHR